MTLDVRLHPRAEDDLVEIHAWYEERQPGLGDRFVEEVRSASRALASWPHSGSPILGRVGERLGERRVATPGFPYVIRYRELGTTIVIMAIYHERRHPDVGSGRSV